MNEFVRKVILIAFLLVFGVVSLRAQTNVIPDSVEFAVLKKLYDSLGGSGWTNKANWPTPGNWPTGATSSVFDTWYGITVQNGDITQITLTSNNLIGQLPGSISQLGKLKYLYLGSNSISGSIPSSFGSLASLTHLQLHNNQLTNKRKVT